jgi:PAS domain S-box-containing protein
LDTEPEAAARRRRGRELLTNDASFFLSLSQDGLHIIDAEGYVTLVGDSFCRMLGYTRDEMEGMHVSAWDARYSGESLDQLVQSVFNTPSGEMRRFETLHRKKDGTVFPVEITATPFEIEGSRFSFNSSRDISFRVAQNREILALKEDLEGTLEALPDLLFEIDEEGRFRGFHAGPQSLLVAPPGAFLGKTLEEVLPPEVADLGRRLILETKERGRATGSYRMDLPAGTHHFEIRAMLKKTSRPETGEQTRYLFLSRDVTDRVAARKQLEDLLEATSYLARANQLLSRQIDPDAAIRRSHQRAISRPPATHQPEIAAIVGFAVVRRVKPSGPAGAFTLLAKLSIRFRSAPAQKASVPAPVMMSTCAEGSDSNRLTARSSSVAVCPSIALRQNGRLIVTSALRR